jgi:putative ABC transport system ATP-binding protein
MSDARTSQAVIETPGAAKDARIAATVRVRDARKRYDGTGAEPVVALDGVSLDVRPGEMVALMGPSGCGKSTLLNLIGCVDLPSSGTVEVAGRVTSSLDDDALTMLRRDRIGTVFQFFNLLPALTIAENVALPLILQRVDRAEIASRVRAALAAVGIEGKADAYPSQVSGGQMQRAAVARATIHRPAIVLADEPTGNLDSHSGASVLALLRDVASRGQAILMATHAAEAAAVCDRVIRMQDGRIVP